MPGLLLAAYLIAADAPPLDQKGLRQAMAEAAVNSAAPALTGRRFRLVQTFVEEGPNRYRAFKSSAQWLYDRHTQTLTTAVGLGEISERNFRAFQQSGLQNLPPLETLFFDVVVHPGPPMDVQGRPVALVAPKLIPGKPPPPEANYEASDTAYSVSFGLAIPYVENGPSALPLGMTPLEVSRAHGVEDQARSLARDLVLVVEGEITDLGQTPKVFCGGYDGAITFKDVNGYAPTWVKDRQCFVTARIDRVQVMRGAAVLSSWPKAAKAAD